MKRRTPPFTLVITALLAVTSLLPLAAHSPKSRSLNSTGIDLYRKGELAAASESFRKAIEADGSNYLAHYNLACTLCLIREKEGPCGEIDATLSVILYHLERSIAISPERRERMVGDADLTCVRSTLKYHLLAGKSFDNPADLREMLVAVRWSVYIADYMMRINPHGSIRFNGDGSFTFEVYDLKLKGSGTYSTGKSKITLTFEGGNFKEKILRGAVESSGEITIRGVMGKTIAITNNLEECGA